MYVVVACLDKETPRGFARSSTRFGYHAATLDDDASPLTEKACSRGLEGSLRRERVDRIAVS